MDFPQLFSKELKLYLCSTQIAQRYLLQLTIEGLAGDVWLEFRRPWIAMRRRQPMCNSVSYTPRLSEPLKEGSQWFSGCLRCSLTPIDLCVDHFTLKPPPDDKGSADFDIQIVKCWSELAHPITVDEYR